MNVRISHSECVSIFVFYVNHCSLTFSDIITLLTRNSVVHFPEFLPGVSLPGKVNYLIIFLKGAINCALNIWDGLKATELPDRPWTIERHCKCSSFCWMNMSVLLFWKHQESRNDTFTCLHTVNSNPSMSSTDWSLLESSEICDSRKTCLSCVCMWYGARAVWLTEMKWE